jgi:hypothetical protein
MNKFTSIILFLILLCVGGALYLGLEQRNHRLNEEARRVGAAAFSSAKPPVLAQSSMIQYGQYSLGFEGKIYNPNPFPISKVQVRWSIYREAKAVCEVEFAFIPPLTTYDFQTNKIGTYSSPYTDLKPEITFSPGP